VNPTQKEDLGSIREALKARPRVSHDFDIASILGLPGEHLVRIRCATKTEQDLAVLAAHQYVEKRAGTLAAAKTDEDLLRDAKHACIVAAVVRRHERDGLMPVWPTGEVLMEEVSPDVIGALVELANMVRQREFPGFAPLSEEQTRALAHQCADAAGSEFPEQSLAVFSHGYLARLVVNLSLALRTAEAERDALALAVAAPVPENAPVGEAP